MATTLSLSDDLIADLAAACEIEPGQVAETAQALLIEAHLEWPDHWLTAETFLRRFVEVAGDDWGNVRVADLYLATAVLAGERDALSIFDRELASAVAVVLSRMGAADDKREEVAQIVRQRVLMGTDERAARLADYRASGSLRRWIQATAGRAYLNLVRGKQREIPVGDDAVLDALTESEDPELALMRDRYRSEFKAAFEGALESLSDRQKVLLRSRFVDGISTSKLARMYSVHRATLHRWTAAARHKLARETERNLCRTARLSKSELLSVRRLVVSQLDVSLSRILKPGD